jgi:protein-S-isoprenylcysteine O-methyltransferase Ste14
MILAGYGVLLGKMAFKSYDTKAFLGLRDLRAEDNFSTEGLLKIMRHPLYSASLLIIIGYFLFHPTYSSAISCSLLILYILIGIQLEERKLIQQFGDQYIEYKKNTPMLIPKFRK